MLSELIWALLSFSFINKLYIFFNKKKYKKLNKIKDGAEPFFYKKGKKGVLLIHGFTSSAKDNVGLGKFLAKKNYTVNGILLKGHGTCPENMATTNLNDWVKDVEKGIRKLKKHCTQIVIAGDSFGGNLALIAAAKHKIDGIVTMGTPIFIKRKLFGNIMFYCGLLFLNFKKKWYKRDLNPEIKRITYDRVPLAQILDLLKGIRLSKKLLPKIKSPILIMQAMHDFGVMDKSPGYIFDKINSKYKKIFWMPESYHVFVVDKNKMIAFKEIDLFFKKILF